MPNNSILNETKFDIFLLVITVTLTGLFSETNGGRVVAVNQSYKTMLIQCRLLLPMLV